MKKKYKKEKTMDGLASKHSWRHPARQQLHRCHS